MQKTIPMKVFIGLVVFFATTALLSGAATADSQLYCQANNKDCPGFLVLATFEDPIHQEDYAESTSTIDAAPYADLGLDISPESASGQKEWKTGNQEKGTFEVTTEIPEGTAMVAYGEVIDDTGVPHTIVGFAGGPDDVESVQAWAIEKYQEISDKTNDYIEPKSAPGADSWKRVAGYSSAYKVKPVGSIEQNWGVYKDHDEEDRYSDYLAIYQKAVMNPGFKLWPYESKYMNERGYSYTDYSVNSFKTGSLFDWDPSGITSGPSTVSVSLAPAPALTWSFTLNECTFDDNHDSFSKIARWDWQCKGSASKSKSISFEPGSTFMHNPISSGTYTVAKLRTQGTFKYMPSWWQSVEKTLGLTQYVTYTVR
jgi:hypothetical protein